MLKRKVTSDTHLVVELLPSLKWRDFFHFLCATWLAVISFQSLAQLPHEVNLTRQSELYFRHLTRDDGLPSNNIRWITADFLGYIWIATDNGLVRYDGSEMKVYQYTPGKADWIMQSAITTICEARDSMLWVGTKNGLSMYDPFTGTFSNYQHRPGEPGSFPSDWVLSIFEDHGELIWIGTNQGLVRYNPKTGQFRLFELHRSENPTEREYLFRWVNRIAEDPRDPDNLLLATRGGLLLFDKGSGQVITDYDQGQSHLYRCEALYLDDDRTVWTGEWGTGLKKLDLTTGEWTVYNPSDGSVLNILGIASRNDRELWLATVGKGVGIFDRKEQVFTFHPHSDREPHSVISNWIQSDFHIGDEGEIWMATDKGISISDPFFRSFTSYEAPFPLVASLDFLRDIKAGEFYMAGAGVSGLFIWDEMTGRWQTVTPRQGIPGKMNLHKIIKDSGGVIWLTTSNGLFFLDEDKTFLQPYRDRSGNMLPLKDTVLLGILEDSRGYLWIGSRFDGIFRLDPSRDQFVQFVHVPGDPHSPNASKDYVAIHEDAGGRIWFGHYTGVTIYDPVNDRFLNHINDSLLHAGIRKGVIWGIAEDTLGRIYLSIEKEGLLRVEQDPRGSFHFKLFHLSQGLSDLNLFDMARDPDGNIWIINEGVTRFNPYEETFQVFDVRNGLYENKIWGDKVYVDPTGNLFLTASGGYETNHISGLKILPAISHLHFEPLEINGSITPEGVLTRFTENISLGAGQNNLVFHYKAICFRDPDQIRYSYLLEGYDKDWNLAGNDIEARYTNLPPGKYIFHLRASHRGEWYPEEKTMQVTIRPYFWQTTWFIILAVLFILFIIFTFYSVRIRQIKRRERLMADFEKKLAESEMQALRAQMNPHFIFNSLNSINNFILKNETEAASDFLTKFSRLVRQVLNNSKNKLVSLEDELTALQLYLELEQLRFAHKFDFEIRKDRRIDTESVMVPPLFIQPYVENAIWHGLMHKDGQGKILIAVELEGERLQFIIEDDGIGRKKAAEYKSKFGVKKQSMGMNITRNRIELLNEMYHLHTELKIIDLQDQECRATGTRVILYLPLINRNLCTP